MVAWLIAISWRWLVLGALAGIAAARMRSSAARHAVWTVVMAGMPVMVLAIAVLPVVPVRVLPRAVGRAVPVRMVATAVMRPAAIGPAVPVRGTRSFPWETLTEAIYAMGVAVFAGRLAYGYRMMRRLARGSRRIARFAGEAVYESEWVSVPVTAGWLRPRIFLPGGWERWPEEKLHAVLVHERNHVRRGDWAVAVLAGVNRCVFWFHPLAWWVEARLEVLAEEACDDASLGQVVSREFYAQVLVELAAVVRAGEGRVGWDAVAMAKGAGVGMRVERILDEGRKVSAAMTRGRWALLLCCAAPVVLLAGVMRPARVRAQDPPATTQTMPRAVPVQTDSPVQAVGAELARLEAELARVQGERTQRNTMQAMAAESQEGLVRLQQEKLMLETQLENLNGQLQFQTAAKSDVGEIEARVRELRAQLEAAREIYTSRHPSIHKLQELLEEAERVRAEMAAHRDLAREKGDLEGPMNAVKAELENLQRVYAAAEQRQKELRRGGEGTVQLAITFGADGQPQKMRVVRGLGGEQDARAMQWAKALRFVPPGGQAAEVTVEVPWQ